MGQGSSLLECDWPGCPRLVDGWYCDEHQYRPAGVDPTGERVYFDLAGTLSDNAQRRASAPSWPEYFARLLDDPPRPAVIDLFHRLQDAGTECCVWTGEPTRHRDLADEWLGRHGVVPSFTLCRANDDTRRNPELKLAYAARGSNRVALAVEDDRETVERLAAKGWPCLLVCDRPELWGWWHVPEHAGVEAGVVARWRDEARRGEGGCGR